MTPFSAASNLFHVHVNYSYPAYISSLTKHRWYVFTFFVDFVRINICLFIEPVRNDNMFMLTLISLCLLYISVLHFLSSINLWTVNYLQNLDLRKSLAGCQRIRAHIPKTAQCSSTYFNDWWWMFCKMIMICVEMQG